MTAGWKSYVKPFAMVCKLFSSPILLSNDGGEDIPYCDYGHDSDSPRYDALVPTASASL